MVVPGTFTDPNADNWALWSTFGSWSYNGVNYNQHTPQSVPLDFKVNTAFNLLGAPLPVKSAVDTYNDVVSDVGANKRLDENGNIIDMQDDLDAMWLNHVITDSPVSYTYQSTTEIPSLPHYIAFFNSVSTVPLASGYLDSDRDGMPDAWELAHGLNPDDALDGNQDSNGDGYTNVEDFLNQVDL